VPDVASTRKRSSSRSKRLGRGRVDGCGDRFHTIEDALRNEHSVDSRIRLSCAVPVGRADDSGQTSSLANVTEAGCPLRLTSQNRLAFFTRGFYRVFSRPPLNRCQWRKFAAADDFMWDAAGAARVRQICRPNCRQRQRRGSGGTLGHTQIARMNSGRPRQDTERQPGTASGSSSKRLTSHLPARAWVPLVHIFSGCASCRMQRTMAREALPTMSRTMPAPTAHRNSRHTHPSCPQVVLCQCNTHHIL
jgi:hypothetical protein